MKLKTIIELISIVQRYRYDENKNMRPDIGIVLIELERERLLRLKQKNALRDNFESIGKGW